MACNFSGGQHYAPFEQLKQVSYFHLINKASKGNALQRKK